MRILLVEDDKKLSQYIEASLKEHGFILNVIDNMTDLYEGLDGLMKTDLIILDRLLGSSDTRDILPAIRKKWPNGPILILSAISTPSERSDLINLGADDYLGKPFSTEELLARVRALLRRSATPSGNYLKVGDLVIDTVKRVIMVGESHDSLPAKEFLLLRTLSQEPGRVWSKGALLDHIWGQSSEVETNVVEATIANVRKKLQELGAHASIKNMRNTGYWVEE